MVFQSFKGVVDCDVDFDTSGIAGKTVIVTGGVSGIGQAYARALDAAGALVCIADVNDDEGHKLVEELVKAQFFHCDVTSWDDQSSLFRDVVAKSPRRKVDYVVANAGIAPAEEVFCYAGDDQEPEKPSLKAVDINLRGALYTTKLAMHYFIKQNGTEPNPQQEDTCLVLIGSGAAYFDVPRGPTYAATKWGMRGMMHGIRRMTHYYGSRVNLISPWYVRTKILSKEMFDHVRDSGVEFAEAEDAGQCLLRILSDPTMNGRSLFVAARKWAPRGYMDFDLDDYGPEDTLLQEIQEDQMRSAPVEKGLFL